MIFTEWQKKYYPKEDADTLKKMSHAWAAGHVNMAASQQAAAADGNKSGGIDKEICLVIADRLFRYFYR